VVEQPIRNRQVVGSTPTLGSKLLKENELFKPQPESLAYGQHRATTSRPFLREGLQSPPVEGDRKYPTWSSRWHDRATPKQPSLGIFSAPK
jgi:hypothetical protein